MKRYIAAGVVYTPFLRGCVQSGLIAVYCKGRHFVLFCHENCFYKLRE